MENTRNKYAKYLFDAAAVIAGAVLFSASMNMFLLPAGIVVGGMTGIATIINMFFGVPVGVMIIILNIPLILLNTRYFGKKFFVRTMVGIAATSVATDFITVFPVTVTDPLLCSLLGGARRMGVSARDTARARVHDRRHRSCRLPAQEKVQKASDRDAYNGVRSRRCRRFGQYCSAASTGSSTRSSRSSRSGKLADLMLDGSQHAELALVISKKPEETAKRISEKLDRGATLLDGKGSYTGEEKRVVMSVVGDGQGAVSSRGGRLRGRPGRLRHRLPGGGGARRGLLGRTPRGRHAVLTPY